MLMQNLIRVIPNYVIMVITEKGLTSTKNLCTTSAEDVPLEYMDRHVYWIHALGTGVIKVELHDK